jgi:hypothetical protein
MEIAIEILEFDQDCGKLKYKLWYKYILKIYERLF